MTKKLPRLVIVMPCYNEAEILPSTAAKMEKLLEDMVKAGLTSADSRVCLVDDGSKDQTGEVIKKNLREEKIFYRAHPVAQFRAASGYAGRFV